MKNFYVYLKNPLSDLQLPENATIAGGFEDNGANFLRVRVWGVPGATAIAKLEALGIEVWAEEFQLKGGWISRKL